MKPITWRDILSQLKADLIGKDSYRGVTLTYSWLANQFGHFALGFIPTLIVYPLLKKYTDTEQPAFWSAVTVSTAWLLFELYNFLGPLLLKRMSISKFLFYPSKEYKFNPKWGNIAFDTFTDLCFFWVGAFSTSLLLYVSKQGYWILGILLFIVIYPAFYWFKTKMYLQYAGYPFQFRLSQWDLEIDETDIQIVNQFSQNKHAGMHLLVFGSKRSGKTSLGVGISTEMSIKHNACLYTTAMKLYSMFYEQDSKLLAELDTLWTWRTASVLVIDDINPGDPIEHEIITPSDFLKFIDAGSVKHEENRRNLRTKNIIWILGNLEIQKNLVQKWKQLLVEIGVDEDCIAAVHLKSR